MKLLIMREMHWDYWTYRRQPKWVIDELIRFFNSEAKGHKDRDHR